MPWPTWLCLKITLRETRQKKYRVYDCSYVKLGNTKQSIVTADRWLPRVSESGKGLRNFLRVLDVFPLFIVAMVSQLYKCHSVFCLLET